MPRNAPHRRRPAAPGYSLLEVVMAIALIGATLVPSVELMRRGMELGEETDQHRLLSVFAVNELEARLASVAYDWTGGGYVGDFAIYGHPSLRYTTSCSDQEADGGLPDVLMDVRTTTYFDQNGDLALSPEEPRCTYRTKLGRFATYRELAP